MIDWPNLLAGAVLGFLLGLVLWMIDRRRAKRERVNDARAEWMTAAKDIELNAKPETTSGEMYMLRVKYPTDRWRSILGPSDFVLLDRLESSYHQVWSWAERHQGEPTNENQQRLDAALIERRDAYVAFANMSRHMQTVSWNEVVNAEDRKNRRRDYLRHPIRTWKRERRNKKVRAASVA